MELIPVKTPIIKPFDDIIEVTLNSLKLNGLSLKEGDILVYAETAVGTAQNRIVDAKDVTNISEKAREFAQKYKMDPIFVQIILDEADVILGGVQGVLLTQKDGVLIANGGVDQSNAGGQNKFSLFPENPQKTAVEIRKKLLDAAHLKNLGIIIADSRVQPMRKGVIGVAIAVTGFEPIHDCRGKKDLFGKILEITLRALADDLTSAAEILMGEADEQTPIVLIRNAPVTYTDREIEMDEMLMANEKCLFMNVFKDLEVYKKPVYEKRKK